jgi:hypothetical protein
MYNQFSGTLPGVEKSSGEIRGNENIYPLIFPFLEITFFEIKGKST